MRSSCKPMACWSGSIRSTTARRAGSSTRLLRDVAAKGPWVSAHPDVILKMGVKEVLHRTRHLGWGTDTRLYRTAEEFRDAFPVSLGSGGARVLKQNRGNAGRASGRLKRLNKRPALRLR